MLDPSLWDSETFGALSFGARILWVGCISNADDEGRLKASEAFLRASVFRYDDPTSLSIHGWLSELSVNGMLVLYEVSGRDYAYLPKWLEYQTINRPSKSKLPGPHEVLIEDSVRAHAEVKRSEVKGSEEKEPSSPSGDDGRHPELLDLTADTATNRWLRKLMDKRPGAGHPLRDLQPHEMADSRLRVDDLIEEFGEARASDLLDQIFARSPKPTSAKQAVLYIRKFTEAEDARTPNQAAATRGPLAGTTRASRIVRADGSHGGPV